MEPSERYLWRMQPEFSGKFEDAKLRTNKDGFRLPSSGEPSESPNDQTQPEWLVLGPSSAFGWGVDFEETYAAVAAKQLGKPLLNASQVGYGISQGLRLYGDHREEWKNTPKTVFIAYGVNDVDRFRFFGPIGISDEEAFAAEGTVGQLRLEKWIYRFAFSGLVMRAMQEGAVRFGCPGKSKFELRQSQSSFFESLTSLVKLVTEDGHQPVIVDSPFLYPFVADTAKAELAEQQFQAAHVAATAEKCAEAKELFAQARVNEPHRVAVAIANLNAHLKKVAKENGWRLIEASRLVSSSSDFVDPIHFSVQGHRLISEGVVSEFRK